MKYIVVYWFFVFWKRCFLILFRYTINLFTLQVWWMQTVLPFWLFGSNIVAENLLLCMSLHTTVNVTKDEILYQLSQKADKCKIYLPRSCTCHSWQMPACITTAVWKIKLFIIANLKVKSFMLFSLNKIFNYN